jgi:hypothetical protein
MDAMNATAKVCFTRTAVNLASDNIHTVHFKVDWQLLYVGLYT